MAVIPLTKGKFAIVDDEIYEYLAEHKWHFQSMGYAARRDYQSQKIVLMHRQILGISDRRVQVDHINGNRLDNRLCNLRIVNNSQNNVNRGLQANNKSGYKGVCWNKKAGKWETYITKDGVRHFLGLYECKHEGALIYNRKAIQLHGGFIKLNENVGECKNEKCGCKRQNQAIA